MKLNLRKNLDTIEYVSFAISYASHTSRNSTRVKKTVTIKLRSNFLYSIANHQGLLFQLFFLLLCTICVPGEQFHRLQGLILLALGNSVSYSNSIVPGGLFVISYGTLLTWLTSLIILLVTFLITSQGISAASAVIKSTVFTALSATA